MRQLTIEQACSEFNIWFKVETEEQQMKFQEEFFKKGGKWNFECVGDTSKVITNKDCKAYRVSGKALWWTNTYYVNSEQVEILWETPTSLEVASLATKAILSFTLDTSKNWLEFLGTISTLAAKDKEKDFISDKCLRKLPDEQLAALAKFLLEKQTTRNPETATTSIYFVKQQIEAATEVVKSFVLSTKKYLTKKTAQTTYWYTFYRREVENIVRKSQAGLYQEELKKSPEWAGLSWEKRGA